MLLSQGPEDGFHECSGVVLGDLRLLYFFHRMHQVTGDGFFFLTYETQFWCFRMNSLLYTLGVATTKGLISALCFYIAHLSPVCVINNVWCVCIVFIFTLFSSPWLIWARSYKKIIRKIFFNFCTQFFQTGSASVPLWHALLFKRLLVYLLLFVIGTVGWTLNGYSWWQAIFVYFCF